MLLLRNKVMLIVNKAGMMLEIHPQTFAKKYLKFQLLVFMIIILFRNVYSGKQCDQVITNCYVSHTTITHR